MFHSFWCFLLVILYIFNIFFGIFLSSLFSFLKSLFFHLQITCFLAFRFYCFFILNIFFLLFLIVLIFDLFQSFRYLLLRSLSN